MAGLIGPLGAEEGVDGFAFSSISISESEVQFALFPVGTASGSPAGVIVAAPRTGASALASESFDLRIDANSSDPVVRSVLDRAVAEIIARDGGDLYHVVDDRVGDGHGGGAARGEPTKISGPVGLGLVAALILGVALAIRWARAGKDEAEVERTAGGPAAPATPAEAGDARDPDAASDAVATHDASPMTAGAPAAAAELASPSDPPGARSGPGGAVER